MRDSRLGTESAESRRQIAGDEFLQYVGCSRRTHSNQRVLDHQPRAAAASRRIVKIGNAARGEIVTDVRIIRLPALVIGLAN
jgi:hypothetical protein